MEGRPFEEQLKALPRKPGVYIFRDASGAVLYVGKAANLRSRVRSYFGAPEALPPKLQRMVSRIGDFEVLVTDAEQEALILECNLIKKHRPRYNVRLKDDKTYPYLKINVQDDWPRVFITRRVEQDGSRYFGPYASAGSVRRALSLLKQLFPFRSCRKEITGNERRPCLEYHINRCAGPCVGEISRKDYHQIIEQVIMFLEGRQEGVVRELRLEMEEAAGRLDYERAAALRDQVRAVESVTERQKITSVDREDQDVIAMAQGRDQAYVEVFFIRNGKLIDRDSYIVQGAQDEGPWQVIAGFLNQFYSSAAYIPPLILLQHYPEDFYIIEEWLSARKGEKVRLRVPFRGEKRRLVNMVAENARQGLEQTVARRASQAEVDSEAIEQVQRGLNLPRAPHRIECYDISDISGRSAVGSMAVLEDGQPRKAHYRRFRIKTVAGADDYAMMQEVLKRRFGRAAGGEGAGGAWAIMPDLVLIDGGLGHLNAARQALEAAGAESIPVASIAKENEEIFTPGLDEPVILPRDSAGLHLLQRARDEAHRFAVGYHRRVRSRESLTSALDGVPGIGPKRRWALLRRFGSVRGIRDASLDDIAAVPGMTRSLAERLKECL